MIETATAAWDETAALNAVDGDRELLVELAGLFLQDSGNLTARIGETVAASDAPALLFSAHTLKGSVGNFAARAAHEACHRLEKMGRSADLTGAPHAYAALVQEIHQVEKELAVFIRR